ncbi:MAG: hypothetical protein K0S32_4270 [Bacteroidetes bacterium]|jgi:phosphoglycerol transferase MdoB-like AlkP superfamily enzyme|nr:hypothetical protein [Bacteroidota bacterium]
MKWAGILKPFSWLILLGSLQRLFIFLVCSSRFEGVGELISSLALGVIYDLSFISVLFFIYFFLRFILKESIIHVLYFIAVFIWLLLNSFDIFSIKYTGVRAGIYSFNLFSTADLLGKSTESPMLWPFIFFVLLFNVLFFYFRKKLTPQFDSKNKKQYFATAILLFVFSLMYLPYPVNYYIDQTSVSKSGKQLAVNPYFSWFTSALHSHEKYLIDKETALSYFKKEQGYANTISNESFIQRSVNYTDSAYNNVIILVLESFGANRIGVLGGDKKLSPYFDSLSKEGTLYTKCFACGPRTQYGISSILYGFPHILGYNLFRENKLKLPFNGLNKLLVKNGYNMHFLHGGDAGYDDMSLLLRSENAPQIKDVNDIKTFQFKNKWGVDDEALFHFSSEYIHQNKGKNLFCILSMSNHEPYQLPEKFEPKTDLRGLSPEEKTFLYSDYALKKFIEELKEKKLFEKSLIIITGDHGEDYLPVDDETKRYHVPLLVIDHKHKNRLDSKPCSHADIAEFILSKTGYKGKSHLIGTTLTGRNDPVFYRDYDDNLYKVTDSVIYKYNMSDNSLLKLYCTTSMYVQRQKKLTGNEKESREVIENIKCYHTGFRYLFENGLYHAE